jgi:soluble lytic murein transglycosylase-like protein
MKKWLVIGALGASGFGIFASGVIPNVVVPFYEKITGKGYKAIEQWAPIINQYSLKYKVDPNFVSAIMQKESSGDPQALSLPTSKGEKAVGLMQVLPSTAKGECGIYDPNLLFDPDINIHCGTRYIARLYRKEGQGDYRRTAAMYFGGPGVNLANVSKIKDPATGETVSTYMEKVMGYYEYFTEKNKG